MEKYLQKVDSDYGFAIAKKLLKFKNTEKGFRLAGTQAENDAADWIVAEMKRIGLENVTKASLRADSWDFRSATVNVITPEQMFDSMEACSFTFLEGTSQEGITGEVIYVGDGTIHNYEGIDVKDKIVLIDTDAYHSYWYNSIFAQAEERGAKAIISTVVGNGPGTYTDDIISVQDIMGTVNIPAVMMTKADGDKLRSALKNNISLLVNIKIDINLVRDAEAHYVYGTNPGRNPNRYILVCGHYDAYWDGFLDNAASLGSQLTIAKAMIDSGYQPESTFVFVTNGAEECGIKDTYFDFATGSNAMIEQHPEWVTNTVIFNNFEMPAIDQTDNFKVTVTDSYNKIFASVLDKLELENGYEIYPSRMIGSDDGIFNKAGAPTYMRICTWFGEENPEAMENYDHTAYDNVDRYEPEVFDFNNRIHGLINMHFDKMLMLPLDFTWTMDNYWKGINEDLMIDVYSGYSKIKKCVDEIKDKAVSIYSQANDANELFEQLKEKTDNNAKLERIYDAGWEESLKLLKINRIIHEKIYKFGPFSNVIFGHSQPYSYVEALSNLISDLSNDKQTGAVDAIYELDNNYLIGEFDKKVYEKVAIEAFGSDIPSSWGRGNTLPFPNLYDVMISIKEKQAKSAKDFSEEIETLSDILNEQKLVLKETLDYEAEQLELIKELLSEINIESIIDDEKRLIF